ncbi:MbeD family mobilization/exclusion protein [Serratia ureilytica]
MDEWENAFGNGGRCLVFIQRRTRAERGVTSLSEQVQSLSEQLHRLSKG